jgi:DNA-binding winged helix-turn-helix (wHTH) protein/tetratricopeptide (TPR) repeat protein
MSPEPARTFHQAVTRFEGFELDLESGVLSRNGQKNRLQGQPLQLLGLLLQQPGRIATREQIQQHLWPDGTVVEFEHSVNAAVKRLREALGDDADKPTFIETIPRRGYRFIAQVEYAAESGAGTAIPRLSAVRELWRTYRFVFATVSATVLIAIVLAAWRISSARPALTGTDMILLATFVNKTGDSEFDSSLDKALEVKLTESPFLSILPEADARATMRTMRHDPDEPITKELGIEVCKRQGLKAVVVPEITASGGHYLITLDAIEARSQMSIARSQEKIEKKNEVIPGLGMAASRLRKRLGESLNSLGQYNAPLELATTSSLEALRAFSIGQTLYRTGKRADAIPLYERAVELDPQFCSAYIALGRVYHSTGDEEASRRNFAKAFALKDGRLTQQEKFEMSAQYDAAITGNLEKETAVLALYKLAYPHSVNAHNMSGIAQAMQGKTEEALREFTWSLEHSPVPASSIYSNASQALMILGRFDESKGMLEQWRQKSSFTPFQRVLRYRIALVEKDVTSMERLAHEAASDDAPFLHLQEELAFLRGDFHKLRSLNEVIVKQQLHVKRTENAAFEMAWRAAVESFAGNYAFAQKFRRAAEESEGNSGTALKQSAQAFAVAGDEEQAEAVAAKLDRFFPEDTFQQQVILPVIRSISERERGNAEKAVNLLAPVTQYPNVVVYYHRGLAYMAAERYSNAAADFQTLLTHRGWPEWELFAPLAQLGLARAYAMQGDGENSRKAYDDFFTTWKDADADTPILHQAKAEYKKLAVTASAGVVGFPR